MGVRSQQFVGVRESGVRASEGVQELWCEGVVLGGGCGVCKLRCVGVVLCENCGAWELQRVEVLVFWSCGW